MVASHCWEQSICQGTPYMCVWTHAPMPIPHHTLRLRVSLESAPEPDISAPKASAELSVKPRSSSMQGALRQLCAMACCHVPEVCTGHLQASLLADCFCHLDLRLSTLRVICWGAASHMLLLFGSGSCTDMQRKAFLLSASLSPPEECSASFI